MRLKLKYHKIKNIPLEVCTCEQKIAYNLAFSVGLNGKEKYHNVLTGIQKAELIHRYVRECMSIWKNNPEYNNSKYNQDAIFSCLNAGLEKYFESKYSILTSYEAIGKMFPAHYL